MAEYPVHIAASPDEPLPPVAELTTIEADSPEEALAKLRREALVLSGGMVKTVWLNVVLSVWPNGNVRQVMCTELPVEAASKLN